MIILFTEIEKITNHELDSDAKKMIENFISEKGLDFVKSNWIYVKKQVKVNNPLGLLFSILSSGKDFGKNYRAKVNIIPRSKSYCTKCNETGQIDAFRIGGIGEACYTFKCSCMNGSKYSDQYFPTWHDGYLQNFSLNPTTNQHT